MKWDGEENEILEDHINVGMKSEAQSWKAEDDS
jgi:hypothetical protein